MENLNNVENIGPEFYGLDERIGGGSSSIVAAPAPAVFPALKKLTIRGMRKLKEWSDVSSLPPATTSTIEFFSRLKELHIKNCPNLITIPGHLLCIQNLAICGEWSSIGPVNGLTSTIVVDPDSINVSTLIEHLLETSRKSLKRLGIQGLNELCYLPKQLLNLASLELLKIMDCPKLMYIGEETGGEFNSCLTSFQELSIVSCYELRCLPKGLLQPTLVRLELCYLPKQLTISGCPKLMYIGEEETGAEFNNCLTSLQGLSIDKCSQLRCLPKGCSNLTEAGPDELRNLTSLTDLELQRCNSRWERCWEEGQFCLTSLRTLGIGCFSKELDYFPWPEVEMAKAQNPQHYPFMSLESLTLWGWQKLKYLPDQLRHLNSLRKLVIWDFGGLEALPEWLGNFSSLESLELHYCHTLRSLPSLENFQLLKNLQSLEIHRCRLLRERCKEGGEEWHKIAHIPELLISDSDPSDSD